MLSMLNLARWFPFLAWPRPTSALLMGEFMAGMTVGLMLLPQGVAYAALAGMPLVTGIYASLIPALVAVLWSASPRLGVGPTALTSLLIGASLMGLAEPGSAHWVSLAVWIALLSGLLQCALGALRAGWLLNLVTSPVLNGFTQAAGLLILASQLPALMGLRTTWNAFLSDPSLHHFDLRAAAIGLGSVVLLLALKRWRAGFPAAMLVAAMAGVLSWAIGFADSGGDVVGTLPAGLPSLHWPQWLEASEFAALIMPVLVISLVSFLETASSAQAEHQRAGTRWNENQDLLAQGMAKISAGLCGSFATSASFSRSAVNLMAGARTGWATVFAIGFVFVVLLWLTPALYHVPQAALAAIVVTAVLNLIRPQTMFRLWHISRTEACIGLATCALTLATAPRLYWGVLAGIVMGLCHFLYQRLHPRIIEAGLHADGSLRDRHLWHLPALAPGVLALRMDAELDFASARALEQRIVDQLGAHPEIRHLCLLAQAINRIDITGVETFARVRGLLRQRGGTLHVSGLKLPVENCLRRAAALVPGPDLALYRTDAEAIGALQQLPSRCEAGTLSQH
ncbi:SulP family inorganic anion transporter [Comamonas antarctica]|uniref:SulP family inorganic anion transporter n=2 Tax=Comamonas antarctica TaxID=2743470 RepID=A0A6N1X1B9_9BURK|nr:SulP family inorganic anion transporter [Comamonas antarctica]QKV53131.1 SulP family inorganic anion transporter [Comamonas antarctica]